MAYERLQKLGEERFRLILNELMRGEPAMALARKIQQEWNEFDDVAEKTLTQQLNRLRQHAAEGMFGKKIAAQVQKVGTPKVEALENINISVMERMEELAKIQRERVLWLKSKESGMPLPVGAMLQATNAVFNDYSKVLQDIQKMRFDMGMDEFKGVLQNKFTGAATTVTLADGTKLQHQVMEGMTVAESILDSRGIPTPKLADIDQ